MKSKSKKFIVALGLLGVSGGSMVMGSNVPFFSEDGYITVSGTVASWPRKQDMEIRNLDGTKYGDLHTNHKHGFGGAIGVGYYLEGFRMELQARYNQYRAKNGVLVVPAGGAGATGAIPAHELDRLYTMKQLSFFLNFYYDFETSTNLGFYIGAGAGGMHVKATGFLRELADHRVSKWAFALQGMAGFTYQINNVKFFVGYNIIGTAAPKKEFRGRVLSGVGDTVNTCLKRKILEHGVEAGLRIHF